MTTPDNRALWELVERCIFSKDLYAVLMDVQNGIDSPALPAMANRAIIQVDRARAAILERPVVVGDDYARQLTTEFFKLFWRDNNPIVSTRDVEHMRAALESMVRGKS